MPWLALPLPSWLLFSKSYRTIGGALALTLGVTALEGLEAMLVPALLVAVTVKVYSVPLVKPVIVIRALVPVAVILPGCAVTV